VTPQQVSTTTNNDQKKAGKKLKKPGPKPKKVAVRSKASSGSVSSDDLFKARQLANQLGGVAKAKAAFDALSQLQE
jgi:hypothetical protein